MFRLTLRLASLPLLVLSAALFLIRAQPYDNYTIRTYLTADQCAGPCFIGIHPGVTTTQQALQQLRSTDLITQLGINEPFGTAAWFWSKKACP